MHSEDGSPSSSVGAAASPSEPRITAIVATRNRGDSAAMTVRTLLASDHPSFEVVVIDQSSDDVTEAAVRPFTTDRRFRYIRSTTVGVGRAQNLAASTVSSPLIAFTDDDCEVPADWLSVIERVFTTHPRVGLVYTNVVPGPHDEAAGFVPAYIRRDNALVTNVRQKVRARGIGAGMAVRRSPFQALGGFDENMGPGAAIPSAADRDLAIRFIATGTWVYETADTAVVHHGYRTWEQGKALTEKNWTGLGAMCAKPVRAGHWRTIVYAIYELAVNATLSPLMRITKGRRPQGLKRIVYFLRGFALGWRTPIDRRRLVFEIPDQAGGDA